MADNVVQIIVRARDEASEELKKLQGNLGVIAGSVAAVSAAATGLTIGLFKIAESAAKNGEEMLAFSQKIGISVEQTSRLKYAAEQSETSLEVMRVGLRFLQKNAADASDDLAKLGITGKTTRDLLLSAADVFSRMAEGPAKAALAIKVFGRAGTEMLPLLNQGAAGIEAMEQKADDLKITMSSTAAVMGDQFNDSVATVKAQIEGLKTRIAEALLPTMTEYSGKLSEIIAKTSKWAELHQPLITATFKVGASITQLAVPIAGLIAGIGALRLSSLALGFALNPWLAASVAVVSAALVIFGIKAQEAREKLKEPFKIKMEMEFQGADAIQLALDAATLKYKELQAQVGKLQSEIVRNPEGMVQEQSRPKAIALEVKTQELAAAQDQVRGYSDMLDRATASEKKTKDAASKLAEELGNVGKAASAAAISALDLIGAFKNQDAAAASWAKYFEEDLKKLKPKVSVEVELDAQKFLDDLEKIKKELRAVPALEPEAPGAYNLPSKPAQQQFEEAPLPAPTKDFISSVKLTEDQLKALLPVIVRINESFDKLRATGSDAFDGIKNAGLSAMEGIAIGMETFAAAAQNYFDIASSAAATMFDGMMMLVNGAADVFGDFFSYLMGDGTSAIKSVGDAFVALGKLVENVVRFIMAELMKAIIRALIVKVILAAIGISGGGTVAEAGPSYAASGGTAKMSKGGAVAGGQPPAVPRGPFLSFMAPLIRLAQGGSLPLGGGFAPAAPPLLRGVSGFTVPGAVQTFDSVPALLAPGEAVLPTVNGRRPADIVSRLEGMEKSLAAALTALSRGSGGGRTSNVTINTLDYSSFRQAIRSGAFRDEQDMAFELGR